ncbi:hypothetical protein BOVMAS07_02860 [Streptococcus uberis]|nr:hypothetical protein [Streptococcus agalactiae]
MTTNEAVVTIGNHIYGILEELINTDQPGLLTTIEINGIKFGLTIEREKE